jgi:hypothetical protein
MPGSNQTDAIEWLNTDCFCVTVDGAALQRALDADAATRGLYESCHTHAYLFAHAPIFVSRRTMERLVAAVEAVVARPAIARRHSAGRRPSRATSPGRSVR